LAPQRTVKTTYAAINETTNNFTVLSAEGGTEEEPNSITIQLTDTGDKVVISKDKPLKRVEGYIADLRYGPENHNFLNRRKTDPTPVYFAGEYYKIVDIKESEVVLLQQSNQKQWIKEYNPTNAPATSP
jgi:hypothetical protein